MLPRFMLALELPAYPYRIEFLIFCNGQEDEQSQTYHKAHSPCKIKDQGPKNQILLFFWFTLCSLHTTEIEKSIK